jgi:hypothetical protein
MKRADVKPRVAPIMRWGKRTGVRFIQTLNYVRIHKGGIMNKDVDYGPVIIGTGAFIICLGLVSVAIGLLKWLEIVKP